MSGPGGFAWFQSVLAVVFVLGMLAAAAVFARRFGAARGSSGSLLKPVASLALGPRERVVVLEAGDTWLVVGVSPGGMRTLHSMPRQERAEPPSPAFQAWLAKALRK